MESSNYQPVASLILRRQPCVALTGAGISAESGIPTFRSKGGLWEKFDPTVYASIEVFRRDPSKYWSIRGEFIRNYDAYQPNSGHRALAELESMGLLRHVITQNIDGLHHKAGSQNVTEIHGSLRDIRCVSCGRDYRAPHIPEGTPPRCECGGVLKPDFVFFGEMIPEQANRHSFREAELADVFLLIGTTGEVMPACLIPEEAKRRGAMIIEINTESTHLTHTVTDFFIEQSAGAAIPQIVSELKKRKLAAG